MIGSICAATFFVMDSTTMDEEVTREDQRELIEDEDDDSELEGESGVQLGYVEQGENALFADSDWRNWDGGKIGGTPVRCHHKMPSQVSSRRVF
jgi:hypothetical protein